MRALLLCALLSCACSGSLQQARADGVAARRSGELRMAPAELSERCQQLDDRRATWSAWETWALVFTGADGLGTIPVELLPEDQQTKARIALVGTGVLALSFAAYAKDRADSATEAWARECAP